MFLLRFFKKYIVLIELLYFAFFDWTSPALWGLILLLRVFCSYNRHLIMTTPSSLSLIFLILVLLPHICSNSPSNQWGTSQRRNKSGKEMTTITIIYTIIIIYTTFITGIQYNNRPTSLVSWGELIDLIYSLQQYHHSFLFKNMASVSFLMLVYESAIEWPLNYPQTRLNIVTLYITTLPLTHTHYNTMRVTYNDHFFRLRP